MIRQRHMPVLIVGSLLSLASAGCDSPPLAPSALPAGASASGGTAAAAPAGVATPPSASTLARGGRPASGGMIFVSSQGLYFDTFVARDPLPMEGRFQLLIDTNNDGVGDTTEFGPGDPGYLGGRWWVDVNGNSVQDADDHFFLCPLLPPGRPMP